MHSVTYKGPAKKLPAGGQRTNEARQAATTNAIDTAVSGAMSRLKTQARRLRITITAVSGQQAFTVTAIRRTTLEALPKSVKGFRARKIREVAN